MDNDFLIPKHPPSNEKFVQMIMDAMNQMIEETRNDLLGIRNFDMWFIETPIDKQIAFFQGVVDAGTPYYIETRQGVTLTASYYLEALKRAKR